MYTVHASCDMPSLIDWTSDTHSQGYTNLQNLVKCLDHRDIVSDTVCSQARLCWAVICLLWMTKLISVPCVAIQQDSMIKAVLCTADVAVVEHLVFVRLCIHILSDISEMRLK